MKTRKAKKPAAPRIAPTVEIREPIEAGGMTEFVEALARIVARLCIEEAVVLSSDTPQDQREAA